MVDLFVLEVEEENEDLDESAVFILDILDFYLDCGYFGPQNLFRGQNSGGESHKNLDF